MSSKSALLLGTKIGTYAGNRYDIKVSGFIRYENLKPNQGFFEERQEQLIKKLRKNKIEYLVEFDCLNGEGRIYYWIKKGTQKTMKTNSFIMRGLI